MRGQLLLASLFLANCATFPDNGKVDESFVFHWVNEKVTMPKFIEDHKRCLGVEGKSKRSQFMDILTPMEPMTVPRWDSMWATFESRGFREAGQRISFSIPSGTAMPQINAYQECMEKLEYRLTYRRW